MSQSSAGYTAPRSAAGLYVARYLVPGPALPAGRAEALRGALAAAPELAVMDSRRLVTVWAGGRGYLLLTAGCRRSPLRCAGGWNGTTRVVHCLAHAELLGNTHRFHSGARMSPTLVAEFVERVVQQARQHMPAPAVVTGRADTWSGVGMAEPALS